MKKGEQMSKEQREKISESMKGRGGVVINKLVINHIYGKMPPNLNTDKKTDGQWANDLFFDDEGLQIDDGGYED